MANNLERELGAFLRKERGERTYAQFARRMRMPSSTLHRLESASQSITLRNLHHIMKRLGCGLGDIFTIKRTRKLAKKKKKSGL